jgi:hypothetical protein
MKAFAFIASLITLNVYACPNLTGTYLCQVGSHISQQTITNTDTGYNIINEGVESNYITDGNSYELPSTDNYQDAKVTSSCAEDKFVIDFKASILYEGSVIAKQVSRFTYYVEGDHLVYLQKTKMKGIPLPTNKFICTLK